MFSDIFPATEEANHNMYISKIVQKTVTLPNKICAKFTELSSHIFRVLSSDALTRSLLSLDQATSDIPSLWPDIDFSNLPSYAPQIFTSLSAAERRKNRMLKVPTVNNETEKNSMWE